MPAIAPEMPRARRSRSPTAPTGLLRCSYVPLGRGFGRASMLTAVSIALYSLSGAVALAAAAAFAAGVWAESHRAPDQP
jgi:hypothetical protein